MIGFPITLPVPVKVSYNQRHPHIGRGIVGDVANRLHYNYCGAMLVGQYAECGTWKTRCDVGPLKFKLSAAAEAHRRSAFVGVAR